MFARVRRTSHASTQLAYTAAYSASVADATMTGMRVLKVKMGWLKYSRVLAIAKVVVSSGNATGVGAGKV